VGEHPDPRPVELWNPTEGLAPQIQSA
jgi:hypothetical protein